MLDLGVGTGKLTRQTSREVAGSGRLLLMEQGSDRPLVADEIRRLTERLGIIEALMTAFGEPHEVLQLLLDADEADDAVMRLRATYDFDVHQAHAVLDAQLRRATKLDRRRIVQQRDELVRELQHLRSLPPEPQD